MAEKSPFFRRMSSDDVPPSPAANGGRPSSLTGTKSQCPVSERKCSGVRAAAPCGICLETVSDQGLLMKRVSCGMLVASCSHQYCFMCVLTWAERTNTCPLCKERFNAVRRKPAQTLRSVGETVEVEHKDPPADPSSENEDIAAALALEEEQVSEESEEDPVPRRRRGSHGYEIDDFVVSEGSCDEEDDDEEWQESSDVEILDENAPSAGQNRRWTRSRTRDNSMRRVRASAVTSSATVRHGRSRTRQSVLPLGRGAAQATGRQECARREERGNSSRVDSHGRENIVRSAELRQLQQEAARVIGDSPLGPRRGRPPLAARSQRPRPAIALDSSTSDDDSDFISPRYGGSCSSDESTSANNRERPKRGGDSNSGASRGYLATYSSKDDADNGVDRARDTGKKPSEEEDEEEVVDEYWVPLPSRVTTRRRNGGGQRSSPSNVVSMGSPLASSGRPNESRTGVASGSEKPPTAAGRCRGGSVNERMASFLGDARRSAAEPTWSPWMSAQRGSSNSEQSLRRSLERARSGIHSGSNRGTRSGSSNSQRPVGGSFGRASSAVGGGLLGLSNRGSSLRNIDDSSVSGGNSGAGRRHEETSGSTIEKENGRGGDTDDGAFISLVSEDEGFGDGVVSEKGKGTKRPRPSGMCDPGGCQSRGRSRRETNIEGFLNQFRFNGSSA